MNTANKTYILVFFLFFFLVSTLRARDTNYIHFKIKNQDYVVTVQRSFLGTDIILHGQKTQNLSLEFPGENLFPEFKVEGDNFFLTWIHYQKNNVRLCWYDSVFKETKMLPFSGFNFLGSAEIIFRENHEPRALVFLGNKSDNDDIFIYNLITQEIRNITQTPENEKKFLLEKKLNLVFIKTETLDSRYIYQLDGKTFKIYSIEQEEIDWGIGEVTVSWNQTTLNSIIGFGDSITAGKMRMYDLEGSSHPELTYLAKLQEMFNAEYGETFIINLGLGATNTYDAVQRMHNAFSANRAFFCLILYGTNDVMGSSFSVSSSAENLEKIVLTARNTYGMYPIISTIPPQKLYIDGLQFYKDQTEALNQKIKNMAIKNNIPFVDSYTAFFNYSDGWEACLEDIKGNHPSPTGHEVMANLFKPKILAVPPEVPANISLVSRDKNIISLQWTENYEFDFSYYLISFGFSADQLDRLTQAATSSFVFFDIPFNPTFRKQIYLKIQAIDQDGNASTFSDIFLVEFGE